MSSTPTGFVPPPYPYDRLTELREIADRHDGGVVDLSVGTPTDAPPQAAVDALGSSGLERAYPPSIGTPQLREAASRWLKRRLSVQIDPAAVAACMGTKELVASIPQLLHLRDPGRDTVLYPEVSYPTYAMGATLAGCRALGVALREDWTLDLSSITSEDAERALCLWVNTPGNPAGGLDDLAAVARWGRDHGVPVLSDECYVEFTWDGSRRTVLSSSAAHDEGSAATADHTGVLAVHSLSKRSNLAGARVGFYAGDAELVSYLSEVRKHAGAMVPGPVQAAAVAALDDDAHVEAQRARYLARLQRLVALLGHLGVQATLPRGAFYLWVAAPGGDAWGFARRLAQDAGVLVSPGEFYGSQGTGFVRLAAVRPLEQLALVASRIDAP